MNNKTGFFSFNELAPDREKVSFDENTFMVLRIPESGIFTGFLLPNEEELKEFCEQTDLIHHQILKHLQRYQYLVVIDASDSEKAGLIITYLSCVKEALEGFFSLFSVKIGIQQPFKPDDKKQGFGKPRKD